AELRTHIRTALIPKLEGVGKLMLDMQASLVEETHNLAIVNKMVALIPIWTDKKRTLEAPEARHLYHLLINIGLTYEAPARTARTLSKAAIDQNTTQSLIYALSYLLRITVACFRLDTLVANGWELEVVEPNDSKIHVKSFKDKIEATKWLKQHGGKALVLLSSVEKSNNAMVAYAKWPIEAAKESKEEAVTAHPPAEGKQRSKRNAPSKKDAKDDENSDGNTPSRNKPKSSRKKARGSKNKGDSPVNGEEKLISLSDDSSIKPTRPSLGWVTGTNPAKSRDYFLTEFITLAKGPYKDNLIYVEGVTTSADYQEYQKQVDQQKDEKKKGDCDAQLYLLREVWTPGEHKETHKMLVKECTQRSNKTVRARNTDSKNEGGESAAQFVENYTHNEEKDGTCYLS
ncbi:hypothetical protein Q9L58_010829, partial [Maublancomyces gigas]